MASAARAPGYKSRASAPSKAPSRGKTVEIAHIAVFPEQPSAAQRKNDEKRFTREQSDKTQAQAIDRRRFADAAKRHADELPDRAQAARIEREKSRCDDHRQNRHEDRLRQRKFA